LICFELRGGCPIRTCSAVPEAQKLSVCNNLESRRGIRVNACKTLARPENTRSATRFIRASRFELPLLGSNQDSPDPESGVLPITPRGTNAGWQPTASDAQTHSGKPCERAGPAYLPCSPLCVCPSNPVDSSPAVELSGLEPLTSWVRSRRSPS